MSYDGGGWTIPYMIGVTRAFQDLRIDEESTAFVGASSGACVALAAALGVPMESLMSECLAWARTCRVCPQLTVTAVRTICRGRLGERLDLGERLGDIIGGRFAVGVSEVCRGGGGLSPRVVSSFRGGAGEVAALVASSCTVPYVNSIPGWTPARERDLGFVDGVLTMRFFEVPGVISARIGGDPRVIRVSAAKDRAGADVRCPIDTSLISSLVPLPEKELIDLYELGVAEGPRLAGLLRTNSPPTLQLEKNHDRHTRFVDLHVGRGRDAHLPPKRLPTPRPAAAAAAASASAASASAAAAAASAAARMRRW